MPKAKKMPKGVSSITRNGVEYWYAHIDGRKNYCGKSEDAYKMAVAAMYHMALRRKMINSNCIPGEFIQKRVVNP
jgi:hypothetical protein